MCSLGLLYTYSLNKRYKQLQHCNDPISILTIRPLVQMFTSHSAFPVFSKTPLVSNPVSNPTIQLFTSHGASSGRKSIQFIGKRQFWSREAAEGASYSFSDSNPPNHDLSNALIYTATSPPRPMWFISRLICFACLLIKGFGTVTFSLGSDTAESV